MLFTMMKVLALDARLLLWPSPLTPFYDWTIVPYAHHPFSLEVATGAGIALSGFAVVLQAIRQQRPPSPLQTLFLAVLITLLPYSHLVPFFDVAGERFLYTPSMGFCIALPLCLHQLKRIPPGALVAGLGVLVLVYGTLSFQRGPDFRSTRTLLEATERSYPDTYFANYELGRAYLRSHEPERAIPEFQAAFQAVPLPLAAECALVAMREAGREGEIEPYLRDQGQSLRGSARAALDALAARWASKPGRDSLSCPLSSMLETSP